MTDPNPPQQPGPFNAPPGGVPYGQPQQPPPPYGQPQQSVPPYGQQPPPPPYGEQQPPPPYGEQPVPPYGQQPLQPPGQPVKKSGKRRFIVLGVLVVVVLAAIAVVVFVANRDNVSSAGAGDCIKVNSASVTNPDVKKIDCNDKAAVFKVAKKLGNDTDNCPTPDYEKYQQTGGGTGDFALCLMLNAKEGDCFADYDTPDKRARVECAGAEVKVVKLVSGKADENSCAEGTFAIVYPEPATTFCLAQP